MKVQNENTPLSLRQRLRRAQLYLVCPSVIPGRELASFLHDVLSSGVDIVQLRDKNLSREELLEVAPTFRKLCDEFSALFIINDYPELVDLTGADGVHLGQDDLAIEEARELIGEDKLIGLSTHSTEQIEAAQLKKIDYFAVGPVHATPTKPGRPAVGLELITFAKSVATLPFFAIGGLNEENLTEVIAAGAERIVVVRALTEATDPSGSTRALKEPLAQHPPKLRLSGAERDAEVRRNLKPLAENERPLPLTITAVVCVLLPLLNWLAYFVGVDVSGGIENKLPFLFGVSIFLPLGIAIYQKNYSAVLLFEALLGMLILYLSVLLSVASNLFSVMVLLAIIIPGGILFWKIIRIMSRMLHTINENHSD